MTYKVFVSHTKEDTPIAQAITTVINNAFRGRVELYLAVNEIVGGAAWKDEVKTNLEESDAIISVVTPESISKPWIYIEWSPFWFQDKLYYTLLTNDIAVAQLIQPMHDRQVVDMTDHVQVEMFFQALANDSLADIPIPWSKVNEFVGEVEKAQRQKQENSYSIYRESVRRLPRNNIEKRKIAEYFYRQDEWDTFESVVSQITDDGVKHDIAIEALDEDKMGAVRKVVQHMGATDKLVYIALAIINKGYLDDSVLREILEEVSTKNQAELRKVLIHLASNSQEDTELFRYISDLMTNMAEFRKVAVYFIQENRYDTEIFSDLINSFSNMAELRKVGLEFIRNNQQGSKQFETTIKILFARNKRHAQLVMDELQEIDKNRYTQINQLYN